MTREEKEKAINALKVSVPVYATTQEEFIDYRQTLNKIMDWLEQEPTTKNDLRVECIDRAQAQTEIEMNASRYTIAKERGGMGQVEWSDQLIKVSDAVDIIRHLPSVTPQEPMKGHWIYKEYDEETGIQGVHYCSECGYPLISPYISFCSVCGADMREVEE